MARSAISVTFDIVVFLGGLNDQGYGATYAQMKAAAANLDGEDPLLAPVRV